MEKLSHKENPIYLFWKILWSFSFSTGVLGLIVSFFSLNTGLTGMTPPMIYSVSVFAAAIFLPIYTLPAFFAYRKRMAAQRKILLLNLFLGWTVVAYIILVFKVRFAKA